MTRDYKKEFSDNCRNAIDLVKNNFEGIENFVMYLSFTKYGKDVYTKESEKFLDDAELDHDLGILDDNEYNQIKIAYNLIKRSIEAGNVY